MTFLRAKKNTEAERKMEQCDWQLGQLEEQRQNCLIEIGRLYACKTTVEQAAGTPYEEMIAELDRIETRSALWKSVSWRFRISANVRNAGQF